MLCCTRYKYIFVNTHCGTHFINFIFTSVFIHILRMGNKLIFYDEKKKYIYIKESKKKKTIIMHLFVRFVIKYIYIYIFVICMRITFYSQRVYYNLKINTFTAIRFDAADTK